MTSAPVRPEMKGICYEIKRCRGLKEVFWERKISKEQDFLAQKWEIKTLVIFVIYAKKEYTVNEM